ncbi:cytidine deaminase [Streptomyces sp. DSM 44917]|uniref:Cytidine deaminase n=1 Tax=Streptomyces boetiae TaxID=3075541 RepID=A0ABU2L9G9_9ACTN|nr:cytidine deaminase [Streptomyces sp. DSM 44917]MDT0308145.1 cytidine deaminase [Streptomyces sp. DSM 44917]
MSAPVASAAYEDADWARLRAAAREAMERAYAPYSNYRVGAAARVDDGRIVSGCNVENASYGLSLCAECGLVSALHATGGGRLTHFTCCNAAGEVITPCGRCRQLLMEHGGPGLWLQTPEGPRTLGELLPQSWRLDHPVPPDADAAGA